MLLKINLSAPPGDLVHFTAEDAPPLGLSADAPRLLREAHLLHAGTFNGVEITEEDLEAFAASFDPADPPPLQLDHSPKARDTQGNLRAVLVIGEPGSKRLRGLVEFLGQEAVTAVSEGRWRKLSLGLRLRPQKKIRELSVTPFPAVDGPEAARVLTQEDEDVPIPPNTDGQPPAQTETPEATAPETQPPAEPETTEETSEEGPAGETPTADPVEPAPETPVAEVQPDLAESQGSSDVNLTDDERAELIALREEKAQRAAADQVETFLSAGKSVPALREKEVAFLRSLSADQRTAYVSLRNEMPAIVELGRKSKPDDARPGSPAVGIEIEVQEMLKLSRAHKPGETVTA